jgi:hypothetical protein
MENSMIKPESFSEAQILLQNAPYEATLERAPGRSPCGGVLPRGEVVWTRAPEPQRTGQRLAEVYSDGVGIVRLDPRILVRADILNAQPATKPAAQQIGR